MFIKELGNQPWDAKLVGFEYSLVQSHPNEKIREWDGKYVISGMVQGLDGEEIYKHFESATPSRHLTIVFNLFVVLQIYNMLCARKIADEINIFEGLHTNLMFIGVWIVIVVVHFCIVQYGGWALKVHIDGLNA